MNDQLLNLAEKAAGYKRGGKHLLKAIQEIQEILTNLFDGYSQFRFVDEPIAFLNNLATSNIGEYGPALVYVDALENKLLRNRERFKPMPPSWEESGNGFYLHNDFKVWIDCATRSDIVYFTEKLPSFLNSLANFLEEKGNENDLSASKIQEIANSLRAAIK